MNCSLTAKRTNSDSVLMSLLEGSVDSREGAGIQGSQAKIAPSSASQGSDLTFDRGGAEKPVSRSISQAPPSIFTHAVFRSLFGFEPFSP
jgi:hypothetical protein